MSEKHEPDEDENQSISPSGNPIYHHQERDRPFQLAVSDDYSISQIEAHIARYIGKVDSVFHELVSDLVHIDVHIVNPTHSRYYYTLVTSGMSDLPMHPPPAADSFRYAELMVCLPPTWTFKEGALSTEANYWPIRWLKMLARLPHHFDTWLWVGHTVPNGDPPQPFSPETQLSGVILSRPKLFKEGLWQLNISDDKIINFFSVIPLHTSEMDFKLNYGAEALFDRLAEENVTELLIQRREAVC